MLNGKKIKRAREARMITQTTIDYALSRPLGTCAKLEDNRATLNPDELGILCDVLKVDRVWLLDGEKEDITLLDGTEKTQETKSLGERVAEYFNRELWKYQSRTGKTQRKIASDAGVSVNTLLNIRDGQAPSDETAEALAKATKIDLRKVLRDGEKFQHKRGSQSRGQRSELRVRVGKLLERELKQRRMTKVGLARMTGLSDSHVVTICRGDGCPSEEAVKKILDATGIDLREALHEGESFYPRVKRWDSIEPARTESPAQEAPKAEPEKPAEEAPKPDQNVVHTDAGALKMQLLRMHAEMLGLKVKLGYDVTEEYGKLVNDLLAEVSG